MVGIWFWYIINSNLYLNRKLPEHTNYMMNYLSSPYTAIIYYTLVLHIR